jgi:hypothetical protein
MLPLTFRNFYMERLSHLYCVDPFWQVVKWWNVNDYHDKTEIVEVFYRTATFPVSGLSCHEAFSVLPYMLLLVSHTQFLCPVQILLTVDPYFSYSESKPVRVHITHVHAGVLLIWPTLIVVFLFSDITQFPGLDFILLCNVPCYKIFNTLRKSKVVGVNKLIVNNGKVFKHLPT